VLDPTGADQPLTTYIARCKQLVAQHPGLNGIFIDNLLPEQSMPGLLAALAQVSAGLRPPGIKLAANVGSYASGDSGSDDGTVWSTWARQAEPYLDRLMLENFMTPSNVQPPIKVRLRGTNWADNYDGWLRCVAAVPGSSWGVNYGASEFDVYGRAAMLLAPSAAGTAAARPALGLPTSSHESCRRGKASVWRPRPARPVRGDAVPVPV
jgi:hypothetical protein